MNCLKCGKKTKGEQVFCSRCLGVMEAYPVKPDVHVQIPTQRTPPAPKKTWRKRRNLTTEELIDRLRKQVRQLAIAVICLSILLAVTGVFLHHVATQQVDLNLGKNYTVDSTMD